MMYTGQTHWRRFEPTAKWHYFVLVFWIVVHIIIICRVCTYVVEYIIKVVLRLLDQGISTKRL